MKFIIAENICTLFGLGKISKRPGTLGSIAGVFIGLIILYFCSLKVFLALLILLIIISLYSIFTYQKKVGKHDKSEIIIDEVVGQLLVMSFINLMPISGVS